MRRRLWLSGLAFCGSVIGQAAPAQIPAGCRPELVQTGGVGRQLEIAPGRVHQFLSGGVLVRCLGQPTTIRADSIAWYQELDRLDFVGTVKFRDSTTLLDASSAQYYPSAERLQAYGDVRLEDENTRSVLTGPNLTYFRVAPGVRDTAELFASGRPLVEYYEHRDRQASPYVIRGDRVRLRGAGRAWAAGNVTIDRDAFAAQSDSAQLNLDADAGLLLGRAQAASRDSGGYAVHGARIAFRLEEGELRWVQAQQGAEATSADWRVSGDTIEFHLARDLLQSGLVWGDSTPSEAQSVTQTITADSLAIDAPDQVLTEVRGYGRGRATSTEADSATRRPDWIAGDTLVAKFDSTGQGQRGLVLLQARGNAQALYHVAVMADLTAPPAINYARGRRITAHFTEKGLDRVDVVEQADGVYLEPAGRRRP